MSRWTVGLLAAGTALALLVVTLVVWVVALGQAGGGAAPAGAGGAGRPPDRYEWVDRERGVARIPIERAMEVVVERAREEGVR